MALGIDSCKWAGARLGLLAGGELLGQERRRVERHALSCPECRARLEGLREAVDVLRLAGSEVSNGLDPDAPSLWPALAQQIRETRHDRAESWRLPFGLTVSSGRLRVAAALAAGILLGCAGVGLWSLAQRYTITVAVRPRPAERPSARFAEGRPDAPRPTIRTTTYRRPIDEPPAVRPATAALTTPRPGDDAHAAVPTR